jgi:hypothetical protein
MRDDRRWCEGDEAWMKMLKLKLNVDADLMLRYRTFLDGSWSITNFHFCAGGLV